MIVIDTESTGENIRDLIRDRGLSVGALAKKMGFYNGNSIYKWMNGYTMPSLDNLVTLAGILDVGLDDIIVTKRV